MIDISAIRKRAAERMSPVLRRPRDNHGSLNAPLAYQMEAAPDPDLDAIALCDEVDALRKRLDAAKELLRKHACRSHESAHDYEDQRCGEVYAFLEGLDE